MIDFHTAYIAAGGNRHPSAADWDRSNGLLAYGSDRNVALWSPLDSACRGVQHLLRGHTDRVNAVRFLSAQRSEPQILITGSADGVLGIWRISSRQSCVPELSKIFQAHESSIDCLAVSAGSTIVISGATDATVKVWRIDIQLEFIRIDLLQTIQLIPRFFPLALALIDVSSSTCLILAVAGTRSTIQVYTSDEKSQFVLQATLPGHEGWVRSLAFAAEDSKPDSDIILASASQDKYIRLWRITDEIKFAREAAHVNLAGATERSLTNKRYRIEVSKGRHVLTFEALLFGHEDWIFNVSWSLAKHTLQLLSASEDNSLAIWEREEASGIWLPITRLGEISALKGSTTATGSTGGFWMGLWGPTGCSLVSLGRTGSWRLWLYDETEGRWLQGIGTSGHTKAVTDVAWSTGGSYLLSTGSDQTTRLHAEWRHEIRRSWHEMSRPQIHGYDLNCIDTIGEQQFISGADEKLLRVFDEPLATARVLEQLSDIHPTNRESFPETADIPVLGLSNKALEIQRDATHGENIDEGLRARNTSGNEDYARPLEPTPLHGSPPHENELARHTLWPEREKIYGHGFEISAVAVSHDGTIVATSCKASSQSHAVIRMYTSKSWRQVEPPLFAHSLTVTALQFSHNDHHLLSVGRDRQWALWVRDTSDPDIFTMQACDPKGHSRMILDACWAPAPVGHIFATAGRDRCSKVWAIGNQSTSCIACISTESAATAVAIAPILKDGNLLLGLGTEGGCVILHVLRIADMTCVGTKAIDGHLRPAKSITQLAFRPRGPWEDDRKQHDPIQIAIASEDSSLRLITITTI